jgi:hypothetical protein
MGTIAKTRDQCLISKAAISSQSSGDRGTPQMFRGFSSSIPQCSGFSESTYTTRAADRLSVNWT